MRKSRGDQRDWDLRSKGPWFILALMVALLAVIAYQWVELSNVHRSIRETCAGPAARLDLDSFVVLCRGV